jgi:hypothetical protein
MKIVKNRRRGIVISSNWKIPIRIRETPIIMCPQNRRVFLPNIMRGMGAKRDPRKLTDPTM